MANENSNDSRSMTIVLATKKIQQTVGVVLLKDVMTVADENIRLWWYAMTVNHY